MSKKQGSGVVGVGYSCDGGDAVRQYNALAAEGCQFTGGAGRDFGGGTASHCCWRGKASLQGSA